MEQCWRWFGPQDTIRLGHIRQAGATGIVSALHGHRQGTAWSVDDVFKRKALIEASGLRWSVCESIPVPSDIKLRTGPYQDKIGAWKDTLRVLARAGVTVVNYNFMPVVDWTRTDLQYLQPHGGYALRFDMADFVAYDLLILRRPGAEKDYTPELIEVARERFPGMSERDITTLEANIIAGLPGGEDRYDRDSVAREIALFDGVSAADLGSNLRAFVREIGPVADELGIRLGIHADDPPFPLFGLPRVVSTAADHRDILAAYDSAANGITLCTGSLGARPDNDLLQFVTEFAPRISFAHLRNTIRESDGSFYEAEHLRGDTDMVGVVFALLDEERRRQAEGRADSIIPMRPDHGHLLAGDIDKVKAGAVISPGYSYIGRLRGLAELRGVMRAHERLRTATPRKTANA